MKLIAWALMLICFMVLNGCAKPAHSTFNYHKPDNIKADNEVHIDEEFEIVWDRLVKNLSESFYVINNIEKASRLINVSFSTDNPLEYADCGSSSRTFQHGAERKKYYYNVAESCNYKAAGNPYMVGFHSYPVIFYVHRETDLEGRINIYVAPHQGGGTDVSVNTRYIMTSKVDGYGTVTNQYNQVIRREDVPPSSQDCSFNTNKQGKAVWGDADQSETVYCSAKGTLEGEILSFASAK